MIKQHFLWRVLSVSLLLGSFTESMKLNFPRLLLPFNSGMPTDVLLQVTDIPPEACVDWQSTAPNHVIVSPVQTSNKSCTKNAVVSAITSSSDRRISYILVSQKGFPENAIACEVITDSIGSIEITFSTNEILLKSPPEIFRIIAHNTKGHTFSALNGVEFQWSLQNMLNSEGSEIKEKLRFIRFSDSTYESPWRIMSENENGLHSSVVLVEGLIEGEMLIKARIKNAAFVNVNEVEMKITVKSNIQINLCNDIYLLQGSTAQYKVETLKQGKATDVPVKDYTMVSKNLLVAKFIRHNVLVALQPGTSVILVKYLNMHPHMDLSSTVHVVKPSYMVLEISNGRKSLKEITDYEVFVKIFDDNNNQIHSSENLRVRVTFPNRLFYVNNSASNGTYHIVRTIVPGSGEIRAELKGVKQLDGTLCKTEEITISRKITIYQAVQTIPSYILLPWDHVSKPQYDIPVKASGGTGFYIWTSSNSVAANVSYQVEQTKRAIVCVKDLGDFAIKVSDKNDSDIFSSLKLSIQTIAEIEVQPTVVEAEIGNEIIIPVSLLGYEDKEKKIYRMFDDCSKIPISVDVIEKFRIALKEDAEVPPFGRGCLSLVFLCKLPGHSRVNIHYNADPLRVLGTTFVLSCHKPIKAVNPVRVAVLAVGTSKEIAFEGGPRPWPLHKKGHYTDLISESPNIVSIRIIKDPVRYNRDLHVFEVLCKQLGETILRFHVGNKVSPTNKSPAKLESSVKIVCGMPDSLHLTLAINAKKKKSLSRDDTTIKVPFYGDRTFEVNLWVRDSIGRKFENISSLDISWELSDYNLANPRSHKEFSLHVDGSLGYRKISRVFQVFEMTGKFGPLKITSKLLGYRKELLKNMDISNSMPLKSISQSIDVKLISMRENFDKLPYLNQVEGVVDEGVCTGNTCPS